jgi:hypothetical protein
LELLTTTAVHGTGDWAATSAVSAQCQMKYVLSEHQVNELCKEDMKEGIREPSLHGHLSTHPSFAPVTLSLRFTMILF